jgi:hypothetical protein
MRHDIVRNSELQNRSTALVAWAFCNDSAITDSPMKAFAARGFEHYSWAPRGKSLMTTEDEAIGLQPLKMAFVAEVERLAVTGQLKGAVRVPLGAFGRIQLGVIDAVAVGEGAIKPVGRMDFDIGGGRPSKVVAQIVVTSEWTRAVDSATQDAIRQQLVSALAAKVDVDFVTAIMTGLSPVAGGGVAELLAAISGGAPQRPYIIGGYDTLIPLAGTLKDIKDLGVGILVTPAASGMLIAVDASGLLIADGGAEVETARHATMTMATNTSPSEEITVSLWQSNLAAVRAERFTKYAVRSGAVAFANVESEG